MRYQKFQPSDDLIPFVECYFIWEGEVTKALDVQSPPNSFCSMVFNYANQYEAYQYNSLRTLVPLTFVSGQFTSNYHLVLEGDIGIVGIVFKPTALYNFFGLRMSNLVNNRMPLNLLLQEQADRLLDTIKNLENDKDRIDILEKFAQSYISRAKLQLSLIDEAVEYIDAHKGMLTVEEVATHLKISRRYLEKGFLEKVGVSPKFYARIKRFGMLSNKIAHSKKTNCDWQEIIFEYGFHDQSNLIKEFMEFNQMNPTDYFTRHSELIRYVKP